MNIPGLKSVLLRLSKIAALSGLLGLPLVALAAQAPSYGLLFTCSPSQAAVVEQEMDAYFKELGVQADHYIKSEGSKPGVVSYRLADAFADGNTLDLIDRPHLGVTQEYVELPLVAGEMKRLWTVSKKEIVLALLQRGRTTEFAGTACSVQALKDHVGVRQNIVAWTEQLEWGWPEGSAAEWNPAFWDKGDLVEGVSLVDAIKDVFTNQKSYAIGCYTAAKFVAIQGTLDYYKRVKKDEKSLALVEAQLLQDKDPLSYIEPGKMWAFEAEYTDVDAVRPGKLIKLQTGVAAKNFVPGDWSYFLNTDSVTYEKTGYEGSNAVYLGRGRFNDYYNDHAYSYAYKEKLHEVFQWRNKVFSRTRDAAKVVPLTAEAFEVLGRTPKEGGLVLDLRAAPYLFGFEALPRVSP